MPRFSVVQARNHELKRSGRAEGKAHQCVVRNSYTIRIDSYAQKAEEDHAKETYAEAGGKSEQPVHSASPLLLNAQVIGVFAYRTTGSVRRYANELFETLFMNECRAGAYSI